MQVRIGLFLVIVGMFVVMACPGTGPVEPPVTSVIEFLSVAQAGGASFAANTTSLVLTFSADPVGLSVDDIALTGATKGVLDGTGTTRTLITTW